MNITIAQTNPAVGAVDANMDRILEARRGALGADLVVFGELTLCGYPPEDLVRKPVFLDHVARAVEDLARATADGGAGLLVGAPWRHDGRLWNAALLLDGGKIRAIRPKHHLPNYGVFDEMRVFDPGPPPDPIPFRGLDLGVMVCEDMWFPDVAAHLAAAGASLLVVLNGSPYEVEKPGHRRALARRRATETGLGLIYANLVGGQDELVFDGASFVLDGSGTCRHRLPAWREAVAAVEWTADGCVQGTIAPDLTRDESIYRALVTGLRDYVDKNRFPGVVLGLSGGIDSALSAAVAVDALGAERVFCVMMPSPHTSGDSLDDATSVAALLGARLETLPIAPAMEALGDVLDPVFEGRQADVTEENVQSRVRGLLLMAISNKLGPMLLTTGNKSEMSVGYATLYGDMCGGYSVLKDVYKTTVVRLSEWRNAGRPAGLLGPDGPVMPRRVIDKPPSAELRPDQKDEDSLPPYAVLDDILHGLVEEDLSLDEVIARGHDPAEARRVWRLLDLAEYKRRQAPPGVKITRRAFGRDRRYPITNGFSRLV